ncbi:MAG: TerD family protein [Haliea sp.]|jgi:tellurium resistance protein TerD|nr:TerD family protein [Haliea sp.]MBK6737836.1 TerD family protein [Haliea sp.]
MAVNLQKGGNVSLSRTDPGISVLLCGLGWDARVTTGDDFDLDASVFLVTSSGNVRNDADFIFFNNPVASDGSVEHLGDNRTGAGDGDDEQVIVHLSNVSDQIVKLVFAVTIYEGTVRRQNFGQIQNAFIRVVNKQTNQELARFDLSEDFSTETSVIFGEVYRNGGEWKFKAVGQGFSGGLAEMAKNHGVNI